MSLFLIELELTGVVVVIGGISFLSHEHGWSADNVRNFEIVLPNGTLTNVNHDSNPTLFSALRGGGSNFGIVTRYGKSRFLAIFPTFLEVLSKMNILATSA